MTNAFGAGVRDAMAEFSDSTSSLAAMTDQDGNDVFDVGSDILQQADLTLSVSKTLYELLGRSITADDQAHPAYLRRCGLQ